MIVEGSCEDVLHVVRMADIREEAPDAEARKAEGAIWSDRLIPMPPSLTGSDA